MTSSETYEDLQFGIKPQNQLKVLPDPALPQKNPDMLSFRRSGLKQVPDTVLDRGVLTVRHVPQQRPSLSLSFWFFSNLFSVSVSGGEPDLQPPRVGLPGSAQSAVAGPQIQPGSVAPCRNRLSQVLIQCPQSGFGWSSELKLEQGSQAPGPGPCCGSWTCRQGSEDKLKCKLWQ